WVEAARNLAERTLRQRGDDTVRIDYLSRVALGRPLDARETATLRQSLDRFRAHFTAKAEDAKALLTVGESPAPADAPAPELAGWTLVASEILNLDEFVTK